MNALPSLKRIQKQQRLIVNLSNIPDGSPIFVFWKVYCCSLASCWPYFTIELILNFRKFWAQPKIHNGFLDSRNNRTKKQNELINIALKFSFLNSQLENEPLQFIVCCDLFMGYFWTNVFNLFSANFLLGFPPKEHEITPMWKCSTNVCLCNDVYNYLFSIETIK